MVVMRPAGERGGADHGWLRTRHSFSFADYWDARWMGWGNLRVLNEDWIAPGTGFGMHGHRDMEILTVVLSGALTHRDSMGHSALISPGEVQHMSAGSGVQHSEFNHGAREPVHLLQIWLLPLRRGLAPRYSQRSWEPQAFAGRLCLLAAPHAEDGVLPLQADARVYATRLAEGEAVKLDLAPGRRGWVQVARGSLRANGRPLDAGDGLGLAEEPRLELAAQPGCTAEALVFDLAG